MTNLPKLIERLESATAEQQRELLWQAWQVLRGSTYAPDDAAAARIADDADYQRFVKMLAAGAHESAALMLVPEGWQVTSLGENVISEGWRCDLAERPTSRQLAAYERGETYMVRSERGEAATPALALTAACLKARQ